MMIRWYVMNSQNDAWIGSIWAEDEETALQKARAKFKMSVYVENAFEADNEEDSEDEDIVEDD